MQPGRDMKSSEGIDDDDEMVKRSFRDVSSEGKQ